MTEPTTTDHPVKRTRATKKAAETVDAVESASVTEAVAPAENVISAPEVVVSREPNLAPNADGVLGSRAADRALKPKTDVPVKKEPANMVALWSEKNIRWSGVGTLVKGYNIVTKEAADKWVTKNGIRKATPEEVATHYGK